MIQDTLKSISMSRIHTFCDCKLKYKYTYIDHWAVPEDKEAPVADVTKKGLALHETFEAIIKNNLTKDQSFDKLLENCKIQKIDPERIEKEFGLESGLNRWWQFKEYIDSLGVAELHPEMEYNEPISNGVITKICKSYFDLLIKLKDGSWIIVDYKTPKSADVNNYAEQLMLYVFVLWNNLRRTKQETCELKEFVAKCKTAVFFPLARLAKKNEKLENRFVPLDYDYPKMMSFLRGLFGNVNLMQTFDFDKNAFALSNNTKVGQGCTWCPYCGTTRDDGEEGFEGCPVTAAIQFPKLITKGVKFIKPEPEDKPQSEVTSQ